MAKFILASWLSALFASGSGVAAQAAPPHSVYAVGQVWQYHTRPGDEGSLLKIQSIEGGEDGAPAIHHISIIGVHIGPNGVIGVIAHAPVSTATLDQSVTELVKSSAAFPDAKPGIADWRAAKGGVFTISVAEIVGLIDGAAKP
jgi:hypothetical protein